MTATVLIAATAVFTIQADAAVPAAPAGMTTVFSDDFTGAAGTGLNTANWLYDIGTSYPGGAAELGHRRGRDDDQLDRQRLPGRRTVTW